MKKKVFISLPMTGRTESHIKETIDAVKRIISASNLFANEEIEFVDNFFADPSLVVEGDQNRTAVRYLSKAIEKLADCDYMVRVIDDLPGYRRARGCDVEEDIWRNYLDECHSDKIRHYTQINASLVYPLDEIRYIAGQDQHNLDNVPSTACERDSYK